MVLICCDASVCKEERKVERLGERESVSFENGKRLFVCVSKSCVSHHHQELFWFGMSTLKTELTQRFWLFWPSVSCLDQTTLIS